MNGMVRQGSAVAVALVMVLLAGCGGTDLDDDNGYNPGVPSYPQYRYLTIALRVVDGGGRALGGATVYVDGVADRTPTAPTFHPLGSLYPYPWRGWAANWESDEYQVVINYPGDQDRFEIRVERPGFTTDHTMVTVRDAEPSEIFIRDVMTLWDVRYRSMSTQAKHEAEVLTLNRQGPSRAVGAGAGRVIGSSRD